MRLPGPIWGRVFGISLCILGVLCGGGLAQEGPAAGLYRRLQEVSLDPAQLYRIREAQLEREDLQLTFEEGTIAFAYAIDGRVTGAFFQGDGEVLLSPPDRVERASLALFTGSAILEERFTSAYLRFNDDTKAELEPNLRPFPPPGSGAGEDDEDAPRFDPGTFLQKGNSVAGSLASSSSLRLLMTFINAETVLPGGQMRWQQPPDDHLLSVRVAGARLGVFDIFYDSLAPEEITVAHSAEIKGVQYFDIWTAFPARAARARVTAVPGGAPLSETVRTQAAGEAREDPVRIPHYRIQVRLLPPRQLSAEAALEVQTSQAGSRILLFELSRFLQVKEVTCEGRPLEFLQNQALAGSALARRGNDLVAVVFPSALVAGRPVHLRFVYAGEILSNAGGGLLYVGARGAWYPNRGIAMSTFDLEFRYPAGWTLAATGKRTASPAPAGDGKPAGERVARYVSERPVPLAGFNLGHYVRTEAHAGSVLIEAYAARGVEQSLPRPQVAQTQTPPAFSPHGRVPPPLVDLVPVPEPQPPEQARKLARDTAAVVRFLSARLGPFPYSSLALTQVPGPESQGWPGLIFLSSLSFLSSEERRRMEPQDEYHELLYSRLMPAHETAHQWWGGLMSWNGYREQWLVEALANYCALLMMEQQDPAAFRTIMERYRRDLLKRNEEGKMISSAGPVTLGQRLDSSRFPGAYEAISYERGTWLFHMLRGMLLDARSPEPSRPAAADPFFAVLRRLRERREGRDISARDVQEALEDALPESLRYEGRKSLEWFFDGWVNGAAIPELALTEVKIDSGKLPVATGKIVQKFAPPELVTSVPLYAEVPGKSPVLLGRVFAEGESTGFRFTLPPQTRRILLDPFKTVLSRP
jgi:hypothetical protein